MQLIRKRLTVIRTNTLTCENENTLGEGTESLILNSQQEISLYPFLELVALNLLYMSTNMESA